MTKFAIKFSWLCFILEEKEIHYILTLLRKLSIIVSELYFLKKGKHFYSILSIWVYIIDCISQVRLSCGIKSTETCNESTKWRLNVIHLIDHNVSFQWMVRGKIKYKGRDILLHTITQGIKIKVAVFTSTCSSQCQTIAYYPLARKGNKHKSVHGAFL